MNRKTVSGIMLTMLLISMLTLTFNIQPVEADWTWTETIYIMADGSVEPPTAPISSIDNVTYTFTDNIVGDVPEETSAITVEKDNIVVDGGGYTLQGGGGAYGTRGIDLSGRKNVTVQNTQIHGLFYGLWLGSAPRHNIIRQNNITDNSYGIYLGSARHNSISGNTLAANRYYGINVDISSYYNSISGNTIEDNEYGIYLRQSFNSSISGNIIAANEGYGIRLSGFMTMYSSYNTISGNTIVNGGTGILISGQCSSNTFYHNNFINNTQHADFDTAYYRSNFWDDGYPSGGNHWDNCSSSDLYLGPGQNITGSDGVADEPYIINDKNRDNYPLMEPWTPTPSIPTTIDELKTEIEELGSEDKIDNQGIVRSLIAKLDVAQKLIDDGKIDQAKNILEAFINEVQAQSGKHITPDAAGLLIESAEYILSHL